ncbi:hypothetical protein BDZ90DRAFT_193116 [Jaminaea rosea]|uniref:Saccharopine dehydrogenase NADP binding domain-containing protein n=1 Tax=Jaminaea rosea TaxID=1569628 RepID=A0A316UPD6_9BASI|nr:hypothetical protein BDZ90DRAFT_193116 [Jaminaea rosea]PWN26834.1 hypothetical protein BDZ90DRAFT_193116 [Jaminaea rosea]
MTSAASFPRKYAVTVYGATGFTGKLCVEYLAQHPQGDAFNWAVAGRSTQKLQALKQQYNLPSNVGILRAENSTDDVNSSGLKEMVQQSAVILNLVGPYELNGSFRLAKLCAELGTSYTDLSGESKFNARLQSELDETAKKSGSIIIPSVGYDSIPLDVTAYLGARRVRELAAKKSIDLAELQVKAGNSCMGGFSGGTFASMKEMAGGWQLKPAKPLAIADACSEKAPEKCTSAVITPNATWIAPFKTWGTINPLGIHNARVAYHSARLVDGSSSTETYGPNFNVVDCVIPPGMTSLPWPIAFLFAHIIASITKMVLLVIDRSQMVRNFVTRFMPTGSGPSRKVQEAGFLDLRALAVGYPAKSQQKPVASVARWLIKDADPGYKMTSRLAVEVSLFLALATGEATQPDKVKGMTRGVRTVASLGDEALATLLKRLKEFVGISVEVTDWNEGGLGKKLLGAGGNKEKL